MEFAFLFIGFADEVGLVAAARPDFCVVGEGFRFGVVGSVAIDDHGGHTIRIVGIEKILELESFVPVELVAALFD